MKADNSDDSPAVPGRMRQGLTIGKVPMYAVELAILIRELFLFAAYRGQALGIAAVEEAAQALAARGFINVLYAMEMCYLDVCETDCEETADVVTLLTDVMDGALTSELELEVMLMPDKVPRSHELALIELTGDDQAVQKAMSVQCVNTDALFEDALAWLETLPETDEFWAALAPDAPEAEPQADSPGEERPAHVPEASGTDEADGQTDSPGEEHPAHEPEATLESGSDPAQRTPARAGTAENAGPDRHDSASAPPDLAGADSSTSEKKKHGS